MLIAKVRDFAWLFEDESFKPCGSWFLHSKDRYRVLCRKVVGESASVNSAGEAAWFEKHHWGIFEKYEERDIYNSNGTGMV